MKRPLVPKLINKTNLFDNSFNNEGKYTKNSILKYNIKNMDKRHNESLNNHKLKHKIIDRELYTRQNSIKLMVGLNTTRRNLSNKKLFLSNSYKRREKTSKLNEIENNKIIVGNIKLDNKINFKHKKLLTLQTNINSYNYKINKKYNNDSNIKNPKYITNIYKPNIMNKLKEFYSSINKDKKTNIKNNKNNLLYNNYVHNTSINKSNIHKNKLLNKSLEQRNKISKFKLTQNVKSKIIKNQLIKKENEKKEKTENTFNKTFIINKNNSNITYSYRNKQTPKIEICQTFSKDGNIKEKENSSSNEKDNTKNIKVNKNEKFLKIKTNYKSYNIRNSSSIPKTSTYKENKKIINNSNRERLGRTPMTSKSNSKYPKLKYLIGEYCINNENNNKYSSISFNSKIKKDKNISFNYKNKNNFTDGNIIQKELKGIKNYINNYNFIKSDLLNMNNIKNVNTKKEEKELKNGIFEVISDIKVKSLNEYEEEKKADSNKKEYTLTPNDNKINNNININININYNNININNQINNENNITKQYTEINNISNINPTTSGEFIEDRDEYNILKETFSKDRFSFRPVNEENNEIVTNYQQYNNIVNSNINNNNEEKTSLDKNDFVNNSIINGNLVNSSINKNKENYKNNIDNKKIVNKELSKIQRLKKIIKNKPNSKLVKVGNLNRSVELRYKKLNK